MTGAGAPRRRGTYRGHVEWPDTDASGIYHNTSVARYVEAAEAALMREVGVVFAPSAPRVRFEVDFVSPLRFNDPVTATVEVAEVGRTSMTFEFVVHGPADALVARGRYVVVHVDRYDGSSSPWPDAWRAALGPAPGAADPG